MAIRSLIPHWSGLLARRGEEDPFAAMQRQMNRLFEDFTRGMDLPAMAGDGGRTPAFDVSENDRQLKIQADLPGVDEKDVDVTLVHDLLTIRGEKKAEREETKEHHHLSERSYGSFMRSFRLPFEPDPDQVEASFDKGVLTITLPKPPEISTQAKHIRIGKGQTARSQPPSGEGAQPGA